MSFKLCLKGHKKDYFFLNSEQNRLSLEGQAINFKALQAVFPHLDIQLQEKNNDWNKMKLKYK